MIAGNGDNKRGRFSITETPQGVIGSVMDLNVLFPWLLDLG